MFSQLTYAVDVNARPPGPSLPPNQGPLDGMMMLYRAGQQLIDIMLFDQLTQKDVEASIPGPSLPPARAC